MSKLFFVGQTNLKSTSPQPSPGRRGSEWSPLVGEGWRGLEGNCVLIELLFPFLRL